jgi:hypothetical protein
MPPGIRQVIKSEMREVRRKVHRGTADVATALETLTVQAGHVHRDRSLSEDSVRGLDGAGKRRDDHDVDRGLCEPLARLGNLRKAEIGQPGIDVPGSRPVAA